MAAFLLVALLTSVTDASPEQPDRSRLALPVVGNPLQAQLIAVDEQWNVVLRVNNERRTVPGADLVSWGALEDLERGPQVMLSDGGLLKAELLGIAADHLEFRSTLWGSMRVRFDDVRGVVLRPPSDPLRRDQLIDKITSAKASRDQLWLDNGDVVSGLLSPPLDADPQGPVFGLGALWIRMAGGETRRIPIDRILAVVVNPGLTPASPPQPSGGLVGFRDGSRLLVSRFSAGGPSAILTLNGGLRLKTDASELWSEIVLVRPFGPRVIYLSDLEPIDPVHVPYLEMTWPIGRDRNVLGGHLRAHGSVFAKGLGVHSLARLAYELPEGVRRFQAELAIDDSAGLKGSVVFRVYLDNNDADWKLAYQSGVVRGGQEGAAVSIDVTKAQRIALIVDFADNGDVLDRANWLSARLVR